MKILSVEETYKADQTTVEKQEITSTELMERAGGQLFNWLDIRLQKSQVPIHIFCGIGDNGGDGLVVGRLLLETGYNVKMYVVNCSDKRSKNFLVNYDRIKNVSKVWPTLMKGKDDFPKIYDEDIVVDAIFGIGLNRCPGGWVKDLLLYLNNLKAFKLAIDIPSGLYAHEPLDDKEAVLQADHTLTFQFPKLSFFLPETAPFVSNFDVLDIGLDEAFIHDAEPLAQLISKDEAKNFYKARDKFGYKNTYGHTAIIGGSYGKIGSIVLATSAAFRIGAGMLTAMVPKCGYDILQTTIPEAMVITDSNKEIITDIQLDFEPDAIAIGMGMGKDKAIVDGLIKFFKNVKAPLVIDADALNMLSENPDLLKLLPKNSILTPHPGELKRLIGKWTNDYEKIEKAKAFSRKHEAVLLIKGAYTLVISGDKLYINTSGNPGMGTAGSGDTLSGVIAGLVSQGYDHLLASLFGVYLHGSAGDIAANQLGYEAVMAGDIINNLSEAYIELFTTMEPENPEEE